MKFALLATFWLFVGLPLTAFPAQDKCFPPDAVVDVMLPPYNAKPDDGQDDTAAIQQAISENVGSARILFFRAGVYDITHTLLAKDTNGLWRAHLTLQGQDRNKVILRLANRAPGFGDPARPKPILMTGSHWEKGDAPDGGGNKAFRNNIFDLTIDTGTGNTGAIGIDYAVSNFGAIKNVSIRSGDGSGIAGIALRRRIPGPGLIKNVAITGFDYGIDLGDIQYGLTLENITVHGQRKAGIRDGDNLLHLRRLESINRVPAILIEGRNGVLTLLDAQLTGGVTNQYAIDCAGTLLIRDVTTTGYDATHAIRGREDGLFGTQNREWASPRALGETNTAGAPSSALLPIEETPDYWNINLSDWEPVGQRHPGEVDDTAAIQRALDAGKGTVYFPKNRVYFLSDTVVVRGAVRQILGMGSELSLGAARIPFSNRARPRPLIRIDPTTGKSVFLENLFFNAQYPGEVIFENNTPATVVIKHCGGWVGSDGSRRSYRNTARGTGKLFVEDVFLPGWEFTRQSVWARQLNPENPDSDSTEPQVANAGGQLWILGFKTEGPAPYLATTSGGVTELLGAYNYVSALAADRIPSNAVPYLVTDAQAALTFATDNFRADGDYQVYLREKQGRETREWRGTDLWPRNGYPGYRSFAVPLYRSRKPAQ